MKSPNLRISNRGIIIIRDDEYPTPGHHEIYFEPWIIIHVPKWLTDSDSTGFYQGMTLSDNEVDHWKELKVSDAN